MRWPWQKEAPDPVFSQTPQTPGEALDQASAEARDGLYGIIEDLMGEIEVLKARVDAIEAWKKQIEEVYRA